jgi:hypothetical protein
MVGIIGVQAATWINSSLVSAGGEVSPVKGLEGARASKDETLVARWNRNIATESKDRKIDGVRGEWRCGEASQDRRRIAVGSP